MDPKSYSLRTSQVKQSELEKKYNILKPLADNVDNLSSRGARWTVASRAISATVGGILTAGGIAYVSQS